MTIRRLRSEALTESQASEIQAIMKAAFAGDEHGGFGDNDWQHALGGTHFILELDDRIVSHASVVERELHVAGVPIRTGYVEAVATLPAEQSRGHGTAVMREVNGHVAAFFELGALGTGSQGFYERLGWQIWRGPTYVRSAVGVERTADEDGYILVLTTPTSPPLDLGAPISCYWRPGDVW